MYSDKYKFAFHSVPVIIGTFLAALLFNTIYQAQVYYLKSAEKANLAAFVRKDFASFADNIRKQLASFDDVKEASLITSSEVYQSAVGGSSGIKDILLGSENPFSPYIIIKPKDISSGSAEKIKKEAEQLKGIEEVRYDPNVFSIAEKLKHLKICYFFTLVFAAGILFISAAVKIFYEVFHYQDVLNNYLLAVAWGILYGLVGISLYYAVSLYLFPFQEVFVPVRNLLLVWPAGIFLNVVLND